MGKQFVNTKAFLIKATYQTFLFLWLQRYLYNELAPLVHALIIAAAIASLFIFIVNQLNPESD